MEYTNLRTECGWRVRRRLNPDWSPDLRHPSLKQMPFHIPPGVHWPAMREDLETLTYDLVGGLTRLLPKEKHCELLGRSPDGGDAFMQSFMAA
jgi:hypothetical protein